MVPVPAVLSLALLLTAPAVVSDGPLPPLVTATLEIDASAYPLIPETKTCVVRVPAGSDGKALLTAATATGCIAGWTGTYFPGLGFFVDGVDGRRAVCDTPVWLVHCTFWFLSVDGEGSATGVDGWRAAEGDVYGFTYDRSGAGLPAP